MSEWPRGFHHVNQVCPCALPLRMYQIAYGTNSTIQSASTIQRPVEMSTAQLLSVLSPLDCARGDLSGVEGLMLWKQVAVLFELTRLGAPPRRASGLAFGRESARALRRSRGRGLPCDRIPRRP